MIQCNVASISIKVLLTAYKQQVCWQCEDVIHNVCRKSFCTNTAFIKNIPRIAQSYVFEKSVMYMHLYKHMGDHLYHLLQLE